MIEGEIPCWSIILDRLIKMFLNRQVISIVQVTALLLGASDFIVEYHFGTSHPALGCGGKKKIN